MKPAGRLKLNLPPSTATFTSGFGLVVDLLAACRFDRPNRPTTARVNVRVLLLNIDIQPLMGQGAWQGGYAHINLPAR
ncbi:hypothetical protein D3C84_631400 [compost metagenome]